MPASTAANDAMDIDPLPLPPPPPLANLNPPPKQHQLPPVLAAPSAPSISVAHSGFLSHVKFAPRQLVQGQTGHLNSGSSEAGPSHLPFYTMSSRADPPHLRLRLHPTQDLVSRLGLLPAFNDLVRPYIRVPGVDGPIPGSNSNTVDEKGKGKEVDISGQMQGVEQQDQAAGANGLGAGATGERKKEHEKGWRSFVANDVAGKYSVKKDTYLGDLVTYPPRARLELRKFDTATLNGFRLDEGQLDAATLQQLGLGPDDKKKHKKKSKKLPDGIGGSGGGAAAASPNGTSPPPNPSSQTPRSANASGAAPSPRPVNPAFVSRSPFPTLQRPAPQQQIPAGQPRIVNGVLASPSPGAAGAAASSDGSHWRGQIVPPGAGIHGLPTTQTGPTAVMVAGKATKVRKERDEGGTTGQGQAAGGGPPRPHKKRKTDAQPPGTSQPPHHGLPHRQQQQQQQPMQQATPTF